MNLRESPLHWSISCGVWFATRIHVSVWFPLVLLVFGFRLGWEIGLAFGAIYFFSVLFHEFGHVVGTRMTGGSAREILIWPLGGLAAVHPGPGLWPQLASTLGGPFVNLVLCAASLPAVVKSGQLRESLNPFLFPSIDLETNVLQAILLMVFAANWIQLLVNLIPVYPLDGGRVVQSLLSHYRGRETATEWYLLIGFVAATVMMFAGLAVDSTWLTAIGAVVLVLNSQEWVHSRLGEPEDDNFAGYDFSQGYTSLEKSETTETAEPKLGWLARWKAKRQQEKEERNREQAVWMEQQVDLLLDKVHAQGLDSLTPSERAILKQAGQRYRERGNPNT